MNSDMHRELQESIDLLRGQFDELSSGIRLPHSLDADVLREQLNHVVPFPTSTPRKHRWRAGVSIAACFVLMLGAGVMLSRQGGDVLSRSAAPQSAGEAAPTAEAAMFDASVPAADAGIAGYSALPEDLEEGMDAAAPKAAPASEEAPLLAAEPTEFTDEAADAPAVGAGRAAEFVDSDTLTGDFLPLPELSDARAVQTYGAYVPVQAPVGTVYSDGTESESGVSVLFSQPGGGKELQLSVTVLTEAERTYVVDTLRPETYDLRLYSKPYADSIPENLTEICRNATFSAEDVTEQILQARLVPSSESGDEKAYYGHIGVLYGADILVRYNAVDLSPQELYSIIDTTRKAAE